MKIVNYTLSGLMLLGFVTLQAVEMDDAELNRQHYCDMVAEYKETGGEYGWPDYQKTYEDECK